MDFLDHISDAAFETIGLIAGLMGCLVIAIQLVKEVKVKEPSSMSIGFVSGWFFIYFFWALYGIRFDAIALIITNCIAMALQLSLWVIVVRKNRAIRYRTSSHAQLQS
ncbi:hypothetical protein [Membranihabitans maritimus]|uniref:hypothetical protein n=1 Tax=Membranihabitans maritimus TaxID=2904244 RepID=UPI001F25E0A1|nr:hypothetical protein [Membranihabitans maritimus]